VTKNNSSSIIHERLLELKRLDKMMLVETQGLGDEALVTLWMKAKWNRYVLSMKQIAS
jgi:hypothetical protein